MAAERRKGRIGDDARCKGHQLDGSRHTPESRPRLPHRPDRFHARLACPAGGNGERSPVRLERDELVHGEAADDAGRTGRPASSGSPSRSVQQGAKAAGAGAPAAAGTAGSAVAALNTANVALTAVWTAASVVPGGSASREHRLHRGGQGGGRGGSQRRHGVYGEPLRHAHLPHSRADPAARPGLRHEGKLDGRDRELPRHAQGDQIIEAMRRTGTKSRWGIRRSLSGTPVAGAKGAAEAAQAEGRRRRSWCRGRHRRRCRRGCGHEAEQRTIQDCGRGGQSGAQCREPSIDQGQPRVFGSDLSGKGRRVLLHGPGQGLRSGRESAQGCACPARYALWWATTTLTADYSTLDPKTGAAVRTNDPSKDQFNSDNFSTQDKAGRRDEAGLPGAAISGRRAERSENSTLRPEATRCCEPAFGGLGRPMDDGRIGNHGDDRPDQGAGEHSGEQLPGKRVRHGSLPEPQAGFRARHLRSPPGGGFGIRGLHRRTGAARRPGRNGGGAERAGSQGVRVEPGPHESRRHDPGKQLPVHARRRGSLPPTQPGPCRVSDRGRAGRGLPRGPLLRQGPEPRDPRQRRSTRIRSRDRPAQPKGHAIEFRPICEGRTPWSDGNASPGARNPGTRTPPVTPRGR